MKNWNSIACPAVLVNAKGSCTVFPRTDGVLISSTRAFDSGMGAGGVRAGSRSQKSQYNL